MAGKAFERGKLGVQRGVDPLSLGRGDRFALDGRRLAYQLQLLKSGLPRLTLIEVNEEGRIRDGHHGVRAAIESGATVDVDVVPGSQPSAGAPSVGEMLVI